MCESCRKAWLKIFCKQNGNIFGFSHTFDSEVCYCTKQVSTNKQNQNKPYQWQSYQVWVFLHFGGIWPTVRRRLRLYGSTSGDRCDGFYTYWRTPLATSNLVRHKASSLYTYTRTCICFGLSHNNMKSSLSNWRIWKKRANSEKNFSLLLNYNITKSLIRRRPSHGLLNRWTSHWSV